MSKNMTGVLMRSASLALLVAASGTLAVSPGPKRLTDVTAAAQVSWDAPNGCYRYHYDVSVPQANEVPMSGVALDISVDPGWRPSDGTRLPAERGFRDPAVALMGHRPIDGLRRVTGRDYVPVGIFTPPAWRTNDRPYSHVGVSNVPPGRKITAVWASPVVPDNLDILPGQTLTGLELSSRGLPGIRDAEAIVPMNKLQLQDRIPDDWYAEDDVVSAEEADEHDRLWSSLDGSFRTLGPMGYPSPLVPAAFARTIRGYVEESVTLGWLHDPVLLSQLRGLLDAIDAALAAGQNAIAADRLQALATAARAASPSQATTEVAGLVGFNADYLRDQLYWGLPIGWTLTPSSLEKGLGETAAFEVRVSHGPVPVPGYVVIARVTAGPNAPKLFQGRTDQNGRFTFEYRGTALGRDRVIVPVIFPEGSARETPDQDSLPEPPVAASAVVDWIGGPDLLLDHLFPPAVELPSSRPEIVLDEATVDKGSTEAGASVTRYYLSVDRQVSTDDHVLGERPVPALLPEETSPGIMAFAVPDLPAGVYWILACADAANQILELDETNNCLSLHANVAAVVRQSSNAPPVCSAARAVPESLWPPNHKLREIRVEGLTDPDGDAVSMAATAVMQDEPVNGLGDGDASPDATLAPLALRAERSGTGNGRVYRVSFVANDAKGGTCAGSFTVCVPHDKAGGPCVDDGTTVDSTRP
ncbi:MAG: hypothetical protein EDX89_08500 [Acidobacteria bacterium]|nr:MAG: hypothetical protein EDX89_08500 [Acidobacteriota bacterium]